MRGSGQAGNEGNVEWGGRLENLIEGGSEGETERNGGTGEEDRSPGSKEGRARHGMRVTQYRSQSVRRERRIGG